MRLKDFRVIIISWVVSTLNAVGKMHLPVRASIFGLYLSLYTSIQAYVSCVIPGDKLNLEMV